MRHTDSNPFCPNVACSAQSSHIAPSDPQRAPYPPKKTPHEQYFPTKSAQKFLNLIKLEAISGKANKSWPKTAVVRKSRGGFAQLSDYICTGRREISKRMGRNGMGFQGYSLPGAAGGLVK